MNNTFFAILLIILFSLVIIIIQFNFLGTSDIFTSTSHSVKHSTISWDRISAGLRGKALNEYDNADVFEVDNEILNITSDNDQSKALVIAYCTYKQNIRLY